MKIEINQTINVPSGFYCNQNGKCRAIFYAEDYEVDHAAICGRFADLVFRSGEDQKYIKCRECIRATEEYLRRRK